MRKGRRRRIAEGVYQDGSDVAATVHVGTVQLEERFPAGTSLNVIQRWRQVTAEKLRANRVHLTAGTLAADVEVYLATLADRPVLQALRRVHLAWWVSRFPNRSATISRHQSSGPRSRCLPSRKL
jgi:hypothetical protein